MPAELPFSIFLADPDATEAVARKVAPILGPGDCLLLSGSIGAGKTHFARTLIQTRLGRTEDVPSPTFTLVQTYETDDIEIWHADLYRLSDPTEVLELGLDDALSEAITLIEWPDRMGDLAPDTALNLTFEPMGDGRTLTFASRQKNWANRLAQAEVRHV